MHAPFILTVSIFPRELLLFPCREPVVCCKMLSSDLLPPAHFIICLDQLRSSHDSFPKVITASSKFYQSTAAFGFCLVAVIPCSGVRRLRYRGTPRLLHPYIHYV